jgi:hypothetical protein
MLWILPSPWVAYQTENANIASGEGVKGPFARFCRYNVMLRVVELSLTKERRLQRAGIFRMGVKPPNQQHQ